MTNALKNARRLASRTRLSLAVSDAFFNQAEAACTKAVDFQRGVSTNLKIVMRKLGPGVFPQGYAQIQTLLKKSDGMVSDLSDTVDAIDELRVSSNDGDGLSLAAAEIPTNAASIANRLSDQLGKVLDGLESLAAKLPSEPREKCLAIARSLDDGHDELDTLANNLDVNRQSGKSPYLKYFQE